MKNFGVLLLIVVLTTLVLFGCSKEDRKPYFSRVEITSGLCGVAPFSAEFRAMVSNGWETGDPTGANMWHTMTWDFGDGATATGTVVYNVYQQPGRYHVVVRAVDEDGDEARVDTTITVRADSLTITAMSDPPSGSTVTTGRDTIAYNLTAESCRTDPDDDATYGGLYYTWSIPVPQDTCINTSVAPPDTIVASPFLLLHGRDPLFTFATGLSDTQLVYLTVEDLPASIVRHDTLQFVLTAPPTLYLWLSVNMSNQSDDLSDDGIHVAGTFNGWDATQNPMADDDGDLIYTTVIELDYDATTQFRFVNGIDWLDQFQQETVPSECRVNDGSGNWVREVQFIDDDVFYTVDFDNCPANCWE